MLLVSYRSDELHRQHPLRPLLAELSRLELCRRLQLEPLGRTELAEVLEGILGEPPEAELTDRLMERTEGNPLYVEELLAASLDGRSAAPESLRDTFLLRVERLSDDAGRVVRAVAVGRSLYEPLIERVSRVVGLELRAALREAVADSVLVTDAEGRFGFRHALLREVITGDLLPGERSSMHLELARALEDAGPEECAEDEVERIGTIASHYAAAGERTAALRTTVRAAREAQRVHAYDEAASLYERALDLWLRVPDATEVAGLDEVDLLGSAAAMYALEGNQRRTEMLIERALEKLDQEADPIRYARLLVRRGRSRWRLNRPSEALADAEQALSLLPDEPNADRARLLSWVARTQVLRGRYREAIAQAEPALEDGAGRGSADHRRRSPEHARDGARRPRRGRLGRNAAAGGDQARKRARGRGRPWDRVQQPCRLPEPRRPHRGRAGRDQRGHRRAPHAAGSSLRLDDADAFGPRLRGRGLGRRESERVRRSARSTA